MASSDFVFIWDKDKQVWVADVSTSDRRRVSNTLPLDADTLIDGARRVRKGNKDILYIPKSKKEELYKAFPDFKPRQDVLEKTIRKGIETTTETLTKGAEGVGEVTTPTVPSTVGLGERIGKSFKSEEVALGAPVPGSGRIESKPVTGATGTAKGYGVPLTVSGGPTPATTKYIDNVSDYATIEITDNEGLFNVGEIGEDVIFLASPGKPTSTAIPLEQWKTNIWGLSPAQVSEFKKAIGYKDTTGNVSIDFVNTLVKKVLPISEANYRNAMNNRPSASWEELIINPGKYTSFVGAGLAGGTGAGPSAQDIKVKTDAIKIYATDLGVGLDDAAINKLARDWASGKYDATTIKPEIARSGKIDFSKGAAAEQLNTLKELSGSYGIQYDQGWYNTAATNILTGKDDIETYKQYVKDQAKSKYPSLVKDIDNGFTVRQIASSYTNSMANLLEIDEQSIGLDDYYINQALTNLDAQGNPVLKPLWQFQIDIRKNDPRWRSTKNAEQAMMSASRKVLQDFGLVS